MVTATATDPQGNTSEVSPERPATLQHLRLFAWSPVSRRSSRPRLGDAIALARPGCPGRLTRRGTCTLSVAAGTLTLSGTSGLTGSGDGTGTLEYQGSLSAMNSALEGLTFAPPPGLSGTTTLNLNAESAGAPELEAQVLITDGLFSVTTTADSGPGSLRQAILGSDAVGGQATTIDFDLPGAGVQTIEPSSPLPAITAAVLIDGWSQPGFAGTPLVEIEGSQAGVSDGLTTTGSNVTVRGLDINNFSEGAGIHITGATAIDNWIYGSFLGTDPTGTQADPNKEGVEIDGGATQNLIGTNGDGFNDAAERNLLSGNLFAGVWMTGQGTSSNGVAGNFIGTDITGSVAINNGTEPITDSLGDVFGGGIAINDGASGNRIGTDGDSADDVSERNVIAGSNNDAIDIFGVGTDGNVVAGNFIGTDVTGTDSLGIAGDGVFVAEGASSNWIGVNPIGGHAIGFEGNVISGNGADGVQILLGAQSNVVAGNKIGTNSTGTIGLGNGFWGIEIQDGGSNTVGGSTAGAGNLIAGNDQGGVAIHGIQSVGEVVQGNLIGTDVTGTKALGNAYSGVYVGDWGVAGDAASAATIGGTAAGAGNVISANGNWGVWIDDAGTTGVVVEGNLIGTDRSESVALGNLLGGVEIYGGAQGNVIGGAVPGAGNVISGNDNYGVNITGSNGNQIAGNDIGTDRTGVSILPNDGPGVIVESGASSNTIGGSTAAAGNLITNNDGPGVEVGNSTGDTTLGDQVTANRIFDNADLAIDLGDDGVFENSGSPRQGPNNLQDFPIIVAIADGEFQGWLEGCIPFSSYTVDVFASAASSADGSGEAQDFLGSLVVVTNAQGQAFFTVPFTPPAGLPLVTATATDEEGNTSEVSAVRPGIVEAPNQTIRLIPGQSAVFSAASADHISVRDPGAGPLDALWEVYLSIPVGTLTLSETAGLTGFGDGTGSLTYTGPLSALNAALDGLTFDSPPGYEGNPTLGLYAQSEGALLGPVRDPIRGYEWPLRGYDHRR